MKRRRGCASRSTACRSRSTRWSARFFSSKSSAKRSNAKKTKRRKSGWRNWNARFENLQETSSGLKAHWQNEKESIQRIRSLKEKIEATKVEEQKAQREGDLNRAAELRYGTLTQLQKDLEEANRKLAELQKDQKMLKEEVDAEDVAEVVAKWTGIPVSKMLEGEIQKLLKMEDRLKLRVIGQDERDSRRVQCRAPRPRRPAGSEPADRLVYFSRSNRRR